MRLSESIKYWWQEPRKASDVEEERKVSALELFYDIVFSIYLARITRWDAYASLTWIHAFTFFLIFSLGWWVWFNSCIYHDLHGNQDVRTRVFTFAQMFGMGSVAVYASDPLAVNFRGFAFSYAFLMFLFALIWLMTGVYDVDHEPYSKPYALVCLIVGLLFVLSVYVDRSARLMLWIFSLLLQFSIYFIVYAVNRKKGLDVTVRYGITHALKDRFSRLVLIILGQMVAQLVAGVYSSEKVLAINFKKAFIGMWVVIAIWWIYYDLVPLERPHDTLVSIGFWTVGHAVMDFLLCLLGTQVMRTLILGDMQVIYAFVLEHYTLPLAIFLFCAFIVIGTLREVKVHQQARNWGRLFMLVSIGLFLICYFSPVSPRIGIAVFFVALYLPVIAEVVAQVRVNYKKDRHRSNLEIMM